MDETFFFPPFPSPGRDRIRVFSAVIEEVSRDRNTTFVTISYNDCIGCARPNDRVRLVVNRDTNIHDERNRNIPASELQRGMTIDATFSSAMTRSIPPQAQAFSIWVIRRPARNEVSTGRIIEVNQRNNYIVVLRNANPASVIRFNLSPNTTILNPAGRRIGLFMLIPGLRVRVEHASFMTASLPPQTTAFVIQIQR